MATSRSSSCAREEKKKSSAPHGAELTSPEGGSRACRTPECAKLCSRRWQLRLCRMWRGALPRLCREWKEEERPTSAGSADPEKVGLTRRGPPTCRHRREWLRHGECAKGRVQPPGEPVKVGRTVETKRDVPTFLGLRVLTSFACALGESALPFMGSAGRGPPTCRHRREWLRHGESAKGRVQPPGEPVKGGRTVETKRDVPAFLGLHVLTSFACALGESALPFMGSATTAVQPYRV